MEREKERMDELLTMREAQIAELKERVDEMEESEEKKE